MTPMSYLELLADDAPTPALEGPLDAARKRGADADTIKELEHAKALSLRVRHLLDASRRRESELTALYDTAGELASRTDIDSVLEAIVRRSRRLLNSDVAYMMLVDPEIGDTYTTITDGGASALFKTIRVPMGDGIAGLVAQTGIPYATASYFEDKNITHTRAPLASLARPHRWPGKPDVEHVAPQHARLQLSLVQKYLEAVVGAQLLVDGFA